MKMSHKIQLTVAALVSVAVLACSSTPAASTDPTATIAAQQPSPTLVASTATPAPTATATPVPPAPTPVPFAGILTGDDLAHFDALPDEFQAGLAHQASVLGHDMALEYLRDLPSDIPPVAEIVSEEMMPVYLESTDEEQWVVLLGGYLYAAHYEQYLHSDEHDPMVNSFLQHIQRVRLDEGIALPPMEQTLSPGALAKLESIDPIMQRAFSLIWDSAREQMPAIDSAVAELETKLLSAPLELPSYEGLGLSAEQVSLMQETPNAESFVRETAAGLIMMNGEWDVKYESFLTSFIDPLGTPEGPAAFARGMQPHSPQWTLISSQPTRNGFWPTWLLPEMLKEVPPQHLFARWPDPEDVLPPDAVAKMDALGPKMLSALQAGWYGSGPLPMNTERVAFAAQTLKQQLHDLWILEIPPMEDLVTEDGFAAYQSLSDYYRGVVDQEIARQVLRGWLSISARISGGEYYPSRNTMAHEVTRDEFEAALKEYADYQVKEWAKNTGS